MSSIRTLKKERARTIDYQIVPGDPAQALLDVVGTDPTNLLVVGNHGLGAEAGYVLGNIPREVVRNAVCNVMVVQTEGRTSVQSTTNGPQAKETKRALAGENPCSEGRARTVAHKRKVRVHGAR